MTAGHQPACHWEPKCLPLEADPPAPKPTRKPLEENNGKRTWKQLEADLETTGLSLDANLQTIGKSLETILEATGCHTCKSTAGKSVKTKLEATGGQPGNHLEHWTPKCKPLEPNLEATLELSGRLHGPTCQSGYRWKPPEATRKTLETKLEHTHTHTHTPQKKKQPAAT
jgi:hypothetical protein